MFNSAVLDVAIGLAFIFLLTSLLVTAAVEALAGILKWRSQHLWDGLSHLLQSQEARNELYRHPLIKGLTKTTASAGDDWAEGRNGPSYIPSRTFALALIDILRKPHEFVNDVELRLQRAVADATRDPAAALAAIADIVKKATDSDMPEQLKADIVAVGERVLTRVDSGTVAGLKAQVARLIELVPETDRAMLAQKVSDWLDRDADAAMTYVDLRFKLKAAIDSIPFKGSTSPSEQLRAALDDVLKRFEHGKPEDVARVIEEFSRDAVKRWLEAAQPSLQATVGALTPLAYDAAGNIDLFRENVEIWFNDGMDRVSGWYKRHTSFYQAVIAFVLAIVMNIDALQITRTLWREPTLRQSLVASAEGFARNPPSSVASPQTPPAPSPSPGGAAAPAPPAEAPNPPGSETVGTGMRVRLTAVRLLPEGMARGTITLSEPSAGGTLTVRRLSTPNDVQGNNLFVGTTTGDVSKGEIQLDPGKATEVEFFIKAGPVTKPSLERLLVAHGKETIEPQILVVPANDNNFAALQAQIGSLGLPIGWACPDDAAVGGADLAATVGGPAWCTMPPGFSGRRWLSLSWLGANAGELLVMLVSMVIGWGITAAATSLGAPFWFDMLKRVVSVRSSGKAPEERPLSPKTVSQPREPGQRPREADLVNALQR